LLTLRIGISVLNGFRLVWRGVTWSFGRVGGRIVSLTWNVLFHTVFRHAYRVYRPIRKRVTQIFAPAKKRLTYILSTRLILHGTLVLITLFVTASSINAEEVRNEDTGRGSVLFTRTHRRNRSNHPGPNEHVSHEQRERVRSRTTYPRV
jgi:hypothetical protein